MATRLTWLGHSAFRLDTPAGTRVYVDPFLTGNPRCPEPEREPERCDLVVVTHGLVIRTLLERHVRCPADPGLPASLANTSVSIVDAVSPYSAVLVNCTRHLTGDVRDTGKGLSGF